MVSHTKHYFQILRGVVDYTLFQIGIYCKIYNQKKNLNLSHWKRSFPSSGGCLHSTRMSTNLSCGTASNRETWFHKANSPKLRSYFVDFLLMSRDLLQSRNLSHALFCPSHMCQIFFRDLHCWASPWRKIAYSVTESLTQSPSLFDAREPKYMRFGTKAEHKQVISNIHRVINASTIDWRTSFVPSKSSVATEMLWRSKPLIFVMYNFFKPSTNDDMNDDTSGFSAWPTTSASELTTSVIFVLIYILVSVLVLPIIF